jgi:hypothetical protein
MTHHSTALLCAAALLALGACTAIPEPYGLLSGGAFDGPPVPASLDPLVSYVWGPGANFSAMQVFLLPPVKAAAAPAAAATGLPTLSAPYGSAAAVVTANATLMLDWGVEHAGWLEWAVAAAVDPRVTVIGGLSEYNTLSPVTGLMAGTPYDGGLQFRLELNKPGMNLYNGLRYAWLILTFAPSCGPECAVTLTGVQAVAQVLPMNYEGSFASDDSVLDRVWYTGAWSTRVNLLPNFFGSELLDRGDRAPPFQGDCHVAQSVGMTAFGSPVMSSLVLTMLNFTDSAARPVHDSNIVTYPLMWVLSVAEYVAVTGDTASLLAFAPSISTILDGCAADFGSWTSPPDQRWSGWDDRLGSGFWDVNLTPESRRYYWMTTLRATSVFAASAAAAGPPLHVYAVKFAALAATLAAAARAPGSGWIAAGGYGIHSLAAAINGGWTSVAEQAAMFASAFNSSGLICSWSNYDTGMLVAALGVMGHVDYALAAIRQCWGQQLAAGATCWWEAGDFYAGMLQGGQDVDTTPGVTASLCHAWGSAPTSLLTKFVAGLAPLLPGFRSFLAAPLLGLATPWLSHVRSTLPTPSGPLTLDARLTAAAVLYVNLTFPSSLSPVLRVLAALPSSTSDSTEEGLHLLALQVAYCGREAEAVHFASLERLASSAAAVSWFSLPAPSRPCAGGQGQATVKATYAQPSAVRPAPSAAGAYPFPPYTAPVWPAISFGPDNTTHGAWTDAGYGTSGWALMGFDTIANGSAVDRLALPPFVTSIATCPSMTRGQAAPPAVPSGALLQDPSNPTGPRRLGYAAGSDMYASWVDVNVTSSAPAWNLTLYFTDPPASTAPGAFIVRVEDLVTRSQIAPDTLLRHYVPAPAYGGTTPPFNAGGLWGLEQGVYLRYAYAGGSLRVKLYCIDGTPVLAGGASAAAPAPGACSSTLSAIFFN